MLAQTPFPENMPTKKNGVDDKVNMESSAFYTSVQSESGSYAMEMVPQVALHRLHRLRWQEWIQHLA